MYGSVALGLLAAALWLVLACLISAVVDRVYLGGQTLEHVGGLLALMVGLLLARVALMWGQELAAQRSANQVKGRLREELTAKLHALGPVFTRGERTGELVYATVTGVELLDDYISLYLPARLLAGLVPAMVFIAILILDPWTLPVLAFTGPILLLLLALIGRRTSELTARRHEEMSWMSAHFLDMLQGLPTLKLFGRSKEQAETIETISRRYGNTTMEVLQTAFQTSFVLELGATAATALVAITVSVRLMNGLIPFFDALAVLLLTPEFFLPLRQLAIRYHAGTAGKEAAGRVWEVLDTPVDSVAIPGTVAPADTAPVQAAHADAMASTPSPAILARRGLTFDDIRVAYEASARVALEGFNLTIPSGQTVALVGPTGAGKTTVTNLLLRFIEPESGTLAAGGVCLREVDAAEWRAQIAWVPQHPYLFNATVADNLRIARPDATEAEIIAAARAAHADEFIERLPGGYDAPIGEMGGRLSGGQRQRLAIARAYLKDAPILIVDEGTSHLDEETEEQIRASLLKLVRGRTVLLVAHRLRLASVADTLVVMDAGRVVQSGTPGELAAAPGLYQDLLRAYEGGRT